MPKTALDWHPQSTKISKWENNFLFLFRKIKRGKKYTMQMTIKYVLFWILNKCLNDWFIVVGHVHCHFSFLISFPFEEVKKYLLQIFDWILLSFYSKFIFKSFCQRNAFTSTHLQGSLTALFPTAKCDDCLRWSETEIHSSRMGHCKQVETKSNRGLIDNSCTAQIFVKLKIVKIGQLQQKLLRFDLWRNWQ